MRTTRTLHIFTIALLVLLVSVAAAGDTNVTNLVASGDITAGDDLTVTDDVTINGDLSVVGTASFEENLQTMATTAAVTIQNGSVLIGSAGVLTPTLGTPTTAQNGTVLRIYASTAQAHTITATTIGFNALDAAGDVCTLGGAIGDGITIVASGGEWYIINNVNCTLG